VNVVSDRLKVSTAAMRAPRLESRRAVMMTR
jgi:hypothetical protein